MTPINLSLIRGIRSSTSHSLSRFFGKTSLGHYNYAILFNLA
jgi:hypothetical protein